jgi:glycosyltransferase involved in cell wall biosynthesis
MKVLMISPYFPPIMAGAEIYAYELSKFIVEKEYEVDVITKHFGDLKSFELMDDIKIHRVRSFNLPKMRSFISFPAMFIKAYKIDCDLIHAHITYPSGIIAYLINKIKKTPYIVTSQGDELLDYPESKELKFILPLLKKVLKNAVHVHCISTALKKSLIENFGVAENKITIIPNGVDLKNFNPKKSGDLKKRFGADFLIINVSRLTPKNNVEASMRAFKKVVQKNPDKKIKYIIAGTGPLEKKLKGLTSELGLSQFVEFIGWIDHHELPLYLSSSDLFIRTPVTEGLGNVFLESMACATPVIASNVQGILDIVIDGHNGLLVNPLDEAEISKKIISLIENEEELKKLGKNCLNFIKDYDWPVICEKTLKVYETALSKEPGKI